MEELGSNAESVTRPRSERLNHPNGKTTEGMRSFSGRQRLGAMSKQGNALLRCLWCEAAMHAFGSGPELKRFYRRKLLQKGLGKPGSLQLEARNPAADYDARPD